MVEITPYLVHFLSKQRNAPKGKSMFFGLYSFTLHVNTGLQASVCPSAGGSVEHIPQKNADEKLIFYLFYGPFRVPVKTVKSSRSLSPSPS